MTEQDDRFFKKPDSVETIADLRKALQKAEEILSFYPLEESLENLSEEKALKCIGFLEKGAITLRAYLETMERKKGDFYEKEGKDLSCCQFLPVTVSFDGEKLSVKTPLTIKRKDSKSNLFRQENGQILSYLSAALSLWQKENPKESLFLNHAFLKKRLCLIVIRRALSFDHSLHCDGDNLENGKIQNAICSAVGITDCPLGMDYFSAFRLTKDPQKVGTEFILCEAKTGLFEGTEPENEM